MASATIESMQNLEFKTRLEDPSAAMVQALAIGARLQGVLRQTDTYFEVRRGRLKLRETEGLPGELVFYERDEGSERRSSEYQRSHVPDPDSVGAALASGLGIKAVVRKRRTLLLLDTARVHLDNVDQLGNFLEFEVPVEGEDEAAAAETLAMLMREFRFTWTTAYALPTPT